MKDKLCNYVEILENNETCVILKVKPDKKKDIIKLGYFDLDDDMFRLTKGDNHTCTVFKDDHSSFSWDWGERGYTLVSDKTSKKGKLIEECITEDFDIYIGSNKDKIKDTLYIKSKDDIDNKIHKLEFMYFKDDDYVIVHKDKEFYKSFESIEEGIKHFENLGYNIKYQDQIIAKTGCYVDIFQISKSKELQESCDYEL